MKDKFANYYCSEEKIKELTEYVHMNFKLIHTKMVSEMTTKLGIIPDLSNSDGYVSLMISLYGRMFNEFVYSLCGLNHSTNCDTKLVIPQITLKVLLDLYEGENNFIGRIHNDNVEDMDAFKKYYLENIDELKKVEEILSNANI